jgi:GAF domain-containing protein
MGRASALALDARRKGHATTGAVFRTVAATYGFTSEQREHLERYFDQAGPRIDIRTDDHYRSHVHIPDVLADPEFQRPEQPRITGIRASVGVPLLRDGVIVGVLTVIRTEPQAFSQKQIELLETFADQAVIAIENVRLFDEMQARKLPIRSRQFRTDVRRRQARAPFWRGPRRIFVVWANPMCLPRNYKRERNWSLSHRR